MNKVLIITYYWPPGSGAGVQRWLKFSKYLPSLGWEPVILTVDPQFATYPATDHSLELELPKGIKVHKTRATDYFRIYKKNKKNIPSAGFASNNDAGIKGKVLRFVRGNFFIPDPRKGWNRFAIRKACEIINAEGIKHIITTSPPHSTQLIGLKLRKKFPDIKWIADLRDPWTDIYYYDQFYPTFISKMIDRRLEKQALLTADKIITVGNSLKDLFVAKMPEIRNKIEVISNGYDEDDLKGLNATNPDKLTISYIGTLSDSYPVNGFLDAVLAFNNKGNECNLKFVGTVSPGQNELIVSKVGKSMVEFIQYVDHAKAINFMLDSSVLLLIIPDHKSNKSIITGKLFEYIASGKPVLCIGPVDGDAAEIINRTESGRVFGYNDINGIYSFIDNIPVNAPTLKEKVIKEFSRYNLTKKVISLM